MQGFDAAISLAIFTGGAGFFVSSLEARWKRGKALKALHELRSIVHVIDMHQLTKDPSMLGAARTSSSPERQMTPFELMRYLDYCSEMLSLTAKIAALYAENISDPVVVDTVGDIERLTSVLFRLKSGRRLPWFSSLKAAICRSPLSTSTSFIPIPST